MLIDTEILNTGVIKRLTQIAREIIPYVDCEAFYKKYKLYLSADSLQETQRINKHVINWLFTIKCESSASGLRFIDIVLWSLKSTLKRNLDDVQFAYVKALIIIFITERKLINYGIY